VRILIFIKMIICRENDIKYSKRLNFNVIQFRKLNFIIINISIKKIIFNFIIF